MTTSVCLRSLLEGDAIDCSSEPPQGNLGKLGSSRQIRTTRCRPISRVINSSPQTDAILERTQRGRYLNPD